MNHSLAATIGLNYRIKKAKEDNAPRSQLIVGAWRAQVHGVD